MLKDRLVFIAKLVPPLGVAFKRYVEMRYWRRQKASESTLGNGHYAYFYTEFFGLSLADYEGRRVLDVGCGPRGSLEWCDVAAERVGLDPLVPSYRSLGIDQHRMSYAAAPVEDLASNPGTLPSPMVGTAYLSPEPGKPAFVSVGARVTEGQTVLIIEAMKTMNQIPAHRSGTVTRILVEDATPVEYGQPLVVIE